MTAKTFITRAAVTAGIGAAILGMGAGPALAQPGGPAPGPGWHGQPPPHDWGPPDSPGWHGHRPPWGDGPAPWGFGPPPPPAPHGPLPPPWGPPPPPFDYWGHRVTPVYDPGFHAWGFWFFGIWIPL